MRAAKVAIDHFLRLGLLGGWILLVVGLLLHFSVKDRFYPLALPFYGLPLPVLAGLAAGLALFQTQARHLKFIAALLCVAITSLWLSRSLHWRENPSNHPGEQNLNVLVWNLSRPNSPSQKLVELILAHQPHIASIVEPGGEAGDLIAWYEERLPGYEVAWMPRGILWFSRLPSRYRSRGKLDGLGAYAYFEVQHSSGLFRFVSVDVFPYPHHPRTGQLREALEWTGNEPHSIIAGDFNTPLESVHFEPYRAHLTNAFEAAGRGFRETWFWGLPLLSLDQIWCGPEWKPLAVRKIHTTASDHAALLATFQRQPRSTISVEPGDQTDKVHP